MSVSKLVEFGTRHIAKGIGRLANEVIESGSGSYVSMMGGRKYVNRLVYRFEAMGTFALKVLWDVC